MDTQLEELLQAQQESLARIEARLSAVEAENAALRAELGYRASPVPAPTPAAPPPTPAVPAPAAQAPQTAQGGTWAQPAYPLPGNVPPYAQAQGNKPPYAQVQGNKPPYAQVQGNGTPWAQPQGQAPHGPASPPPSAFQPPANGVAAPPKNEAQTELRIGRITGIVGLLLILVGVVLALRYTYLHLLTSDWLRLGLAYLLGTGFLAAGEMLSRKNKTAFSLTLLAGGVGIGLATTAAGYFNLRAIPPLAACGICVLVAAIALALAMIHKSQLIGVFALVGGYMPMLAVDGMLTGPAKIYLLFLNFLVLFLAINRDWRVLKCLSLACNTAALVYLFALEAILTGGEFTLAVVGDLAYLLGCFAIYMAVCLLLAVRQKKNLTDLDTILIGVNTWVHFMLAQWVLTMHGVTRAGGLIAFALSAGFWLFARASRKFLPRDHSARGLFYTNSAVLLAMGIALFFRGDVQLYAFLGAGSVIWCAGIHADKHWYRRTGGFIFAIGVALFALRYGIVGGAFFSSAGQQHTILPFAVVVVLAMLVLVSLLFKYRQTVDDLAIPRKGFWQAYQMAALGAAIFYIVWLVRPVLEVMLETYTTADSTLLTYWQNLITGTLLFLLPMGLRRIKYFWAKGTLAVCNLSTLGGFLFATFVCSPVSYLGTALRVMLAALYSTAVLGLILAVGTLPKQNPLRKDRQAPLAVLASLFFLTIYLVVQFDVPFNGILLSVLYLLAGLGCLAAGFIGLKIVLRRFGLALLYLSITKLFLLDLAFLPSGQRIISYFAFGFGLLGTSWVYQHYEKRLTQGDGKPPF